MPTAPRDFLQWNNRWQLNDSNEIWCSRCRKLWSGFTHLRSRFILWRLLSHGFYCNQRGTLWGVDPACPVCLDAPESLDHLFFSCTRVFYQWECLCRETRNTPLDISDCRSLGEIILQDIARQRRCPTLFILVTETLVATWNDGNTIVFRDKWTMVPLAFIWRRVALNLEAIWIRITNPRISRVISQDIELIKSFFDDLSLQGDLQPDYDYAYNLFFLSPAGGWRVSVPGGSTSRVPCSGGWFSPLPSFQ